MSATLVLTICAIVILAVVIQLLCWVFGIGTSLSDVLDACEKLTRPPVDEDTAPQDRAADDPAWILRLPPYTPSMGGTPAEANMLAYSQHPSRNRSYYCPVCERPKARAAMRRHQPYAFPGDNPLLCTEHMPTLEMPALPKSGTTHTANDGR